MQEITSDIDRTETTYVNIMTNDDRTNSSTNTFAQSNIATKHQTIGVLYTNADCLSNKVSELTALVDMEKYDVICISETLPKNVTEKEGYLNIELEGYEGFHTNTGRGVSIYVRDHIKCERIELTTRFNDHIWMKLRMNNNCDILIGCIYRSPNSSNENNEALLNLLQEACNINTLQKIIVGDFNYKEIDWLNGVVNARETHAAAKTFDRVNDLFLSQLITEPTRYREGERENLLDWILTDNAEKIDDIVLKPPLGEKGDHCVISFKVDFNYETIRHGDQLNYFKANFEAIKSSLDEIEWEEELFNKNVDEAWTLFLDKLNRLIAIFIPKRKNRNRKSKPWVNLNVKSSIKAKNKAWKDYKKDRSIEKWNIFKAVRNESNREVHRNKQQFEQKVANEIKTNPKQFWSYLKSKSKKQQNFPNILDNQGHHISGDRDKADLFNKYFASVYTVEDTQVLPTLESRSGENYLPSINITADSIELKLKKLNTSKSAGPDKLHAKILHELRKEISKPLCIIFTKSLVEGKLPDDWKKANIKPLHKKGNKNMVSNYRPVSLTSICCKTMERLVRDDMVKHLENNLLLSKDQHGFRTGRSCSTQLLEIMELWTSFIDNGMNVDCIYLDFAKAFDKVPHLRLINKLESYGFTGDLINWLRNFLVNRQQRVIINGIQSDVELVTSGIPQGSVLGPTLFVIFINDLPDKVKTHVKIFADDTKIFNAIKTSEESSILQDDINQLVEWTQKWQLPFNMEKTKVLHYGRNNSEHNYQIGGLNIEKDCSEKDLGVTFDNSLKFSTHIASIVQKANSRLGIIKRNFSITSKEIIIPLYKSLVRPILEYGSSIWNPALRRDYLEIEKVQRRATKMISNISHLSYENRLRHLKLDSLAFRRRRSDMIQVYRIIHKIDNINFTDFFQFNVESATLGHSLKLKKPRINNNLRQNAFAIRVINDWNQLKDETVTSTSINIFKTNLAAEWDNHPERYFEN